MTTENTWSVDLKSKTATHASGFSLTVEGNPKDPSSVSPGRTPKDIGAHEQVKLLRLGLEALADASGPSGDDVSGPSIRKVSKEAYQRPANLPRKPLLSLKKSKPDA